MGIATKQGFVDIMITLLERQASFLQQAIKAFKDLAAGEGTSEIGQAVMAASKTSKKLKKKLATDPNKPKRSPSGYHLYMSVHTSSFKEENPDKNQTEILAVVAKKWRESTFDEKSIYMKQAAALKDEYDLKLEEYNEGLRSALSDPFSKAYATTTAPTAFLPSEELNFLRKRSSDVLTAEEDDKETPTKKFKDM